MMLTTTAREFRPDAATLSHTSAEDLQPNEAINKRQRAAPPTVLSASIKPLQFNNLRWSRGGGSHSNGIGQQGAATDSSYGGWTQHARRGNKSWGGTFNARGGGRGRGASSSPAWRRPSASFRTADSPQTSNTLAPMRPPILKQDQPDETLFSHPNSLPYRMRPVSMPKPLTFKHYSHPQPPVSSSVTKPLMDIHYLSGSNATYQLIPNSPTSPRTYQEPPESPDPAPPLILKRSASPPTIFARGSTPPPKRRKLGHSGPPTVVKVEEADPFSSSHNFQSHFSVTPEVTKVEKRSSSPPPRRLVTESCSLYPLPEDCRKSNPEHKKNRQAFFAREYNVLKCLGLKRTKVIFRDDGMVIEWTSNTPVWSDTLRPEPSNLSSVIDEALQANCSSLSGKQRSTTPRRSRSRSVESHTIVAEDSSSSRQATWSVEPKSPPQSGAKEQGKRPVSSPSIPLPRRRIFHKPELPQVTSREENVHTTTTPTTITNVTNDNNGIQPELGQDNASTIHKDNDRPTSPSTSTTIPIAIKTTITPSNTQVWSAEELGRVEPMAVDYLQRYIRAFDTDRSALQNAYSEDALFSYRMTLVSPFSSTSQSSSFISYRIPQVTSSLSAMLPLYKFCLRDGAGEVHYDVVSLDGRAGGGILLTVHGALGSADSNAELAGRREYDHLVAVDHSFVLHRNRLGDGDGVDGNGKGVGYTGGADGKQTLAPWPLVAVSHQMVLRDFDVRSGRIKFPLPITSSLEQFPWLA